MVNPEPGAYEEKYPKKIFASGFPVSRVPWLPEAINDLIGTVSVLRCSIGCIFGWRILKKNVQLRL
jgi:hypothetical protein